MGKHTCDADQTLEAFHALLIPLITALPTARTRAQELPDAWALAFLPDGTFLATERRRDLRGMEPGGGSSPPVKDRWGNLLGGSLTYTRLIRLELARPGEGTVRREARPRPDLGERVRDVRQGWDGYIDLPTDQPAGRLRRLKP